METKIPAKAGHDFCKLINVEECKRLIRDCVTALTHERTMLSAAEAHPKPIDESVLKLLDLGARPGLNSVDLAKARVAYYEAAQDRLWAWYRRLTSG